MNTTLFNCLICQDNSIFSSFYHSITSLILILTETKADFLSFQFYLWSFQKASVPACPNNPVSCSPVWGDDEEVLWRCGRPLWAPGGMLPDTGTPARGFGLLTCNHANTEAEIPALLSQYLSLVLEFTLLSTKWNQAALELPGDCFLPCAKSTELLSEGFCFLFKEHLINAGDLTASTRVACNLYSIVLSLLKKLN